MGRVVVETVLVVLDVEAEEITALILYSGKHRHRLNCTDDFFGNHFHRGQDGDDVCINAMGGIIGRRFFGVACD